MDKIEVEKIILEHLTNNQKTSTDEIEGAVKKVLRQRGTIGPQSRPQYGAVLKWDERITDEDALLINEVIYDYLYKRIITPGVNSDNLNLPYVHVSDETKLNNRKVEIK
ncbi:hypothetical protein [Halobacillus sp. H74]|uniref:hypothetical protein n=1 Tax=Halobacillus sp. H74 TaxID=3457436 RepID=UPI003FCD932C